MWLAARRVAAMVTCTARLNALRRVWRVLMCSARRVSPASAMLRTASQYAVTGYRPSLVRPQDLRCWCSGSKLRRSAGSARSTAVPSRSKPPYLWTAAAFSPAPRGRCRGRSGAHEAAVALVRRQRPAVLHQLHRGVWRVQIDVHPLGRVAAPHHGLARRAERATAAAAHAGLTNALHVRPCVTTIAVSTGHSTRSASSVTATGGRVSRLVRRRWAGGAAALTERKERVDPERHIEKALPLRHAGVERPCGRPSARTAGGGAPMRGRHAPWCCRMRTIRWYSCRKFLRTCLRPAPSSSPQSCRRPSAPTRAASLPHHAHPPAPRAAETRRRRTPSPPLPPGSGPQSAAPA